MSARIIRITLAASLLLVGCGGPQSEPESPSASCQSADDCRRHFADSCPGGSSVFTECREGQCHFVGCSSPIGTPCDGDPSTVFENEDCPDQEASQPGCTSDGECEEQLRSECPGGSVAYATCNAGTCELEGCSSPIGTPCDGDPSTVFEGEECD